MNRESAAQEVMRHVDRFMDFGVSEGPSPADRRLYRAALRLVKQGVLFITSDTEQTFKTNRGCHRMCATSVHRAIVVKRTEQLDNFN